MYITDSSLIYSLIQLKDLHPFFGITFLVFKKGDLPVEHSVDFSISQDETIFLNEYFKPELNSDYYFRAFRLSDKSKFWLRKDYPTSGSQKLRTVGKFAEALFHEQGSTKWTWKNNYVSLLKEAMVHSQQSPLPAFALALWLNKEKDFKTNITPDDLVAKFLDDYNIRKTEIDLFDLHIPSFFLENYSLLSKEKYNWSYIKKVLRIPPPPDTPSDKEGSLNMIRLFNVGPAKSLSLELNERLNIITGDNGLGKSFILDCAWWALTKSWISIPAIPKERSHSRMTFQITGSKGNSEIIFSNYNWDSSSWVISKNAKNTITSGLAIYVRVDGSISVWDPLNENNDRNIAYNFSQSDIWDGLLVKDAVRTRKVCNGLIDDWVEWSEEKQEEFKIFTNVLSKLSPINDSDLGELKPGKIVKFPWDSRKIPTIVHSYGSVPVTLCSAAVKRVLSISYMLVWLWVRHKEKASYLKQNYQTKMVILLDEIEAHLHPKWQRTIMPALLSIANELDASLDLQFIIATHSPSVMVSTESFFDSDSDKIFHLNIEKGDVVIDQYEYQKHGTVDSWLTSDIFELKQATNVKAEQWIELAKEAMNNKNITKPQIDEISKQLSELLPAHHRFWIRWNFFAQTRNSK